MAEELKTDEEQVEAIKKWWDENGKSLIVTVVVVLTGYFGWNGYQDSVRTKGEAAATVYQQLLNKVTKPAAEQTEADKVEMEALAAQLKADYEGTLYAEFAGLYLAKFAIEGENFEGAANELKALVAATSEGPVKYLAQVRLARVYIQLGQLDDALALVNLVPDAAFTAQYEEAKGDALYAKGELADARNAYQSAKAAAQSLGVNTQLLQRKIDDLAGAQQGEQAKQDA